MKQEVYVKGIWPRAAKECAHRIANAKSRRSGKREAKEQRNGR